MTPKERFLAILKGEPVDRVGVACPVQTATVELMEASGAWWPEAHRDPEKMAKLALAAYEVAGVESVRVPFDVAIEGEAFGCEVGKWVKDSAPQLLSHLINSKEDLERLRIPEPKRDGRLPVVLKAVELLSKEVGNDIPVIAKIESPIGLASYLMDAEMFYQYLITDPELVHGVMRLSNKFLKSFSKALIEAGADAIFILDASANTEYFGLEFYYKFSHPYITELIIEIQEAGCPTIIHNCSAKPVIESMIETTTRGISIDRKADMAEASKIARGRVALFGNIDPIDVILSGSPEDVMKQARECIEKGTNNLCPGCGIPPNTPTANIRAMVQAAKESITT